MARGASKCLFLFFLSVLIVCSSGTLVGFFYDARKSNAISSATETISFLKLNKVSPSQIWVLVADHRVLDGFPHTGVPVDLYLNRTQVENLRNYKPSAISLLKTHLSIKNIIVSSSSNDLPMLLSTLKSIHSILGSFHLDREVKVSVMLPLSFLEKLNNKHERELHRIIDFIKKARSVVIVEANIDGELSMGDRFVESAIKRAALAASVLHYKDVSMVLTIKSYAVPSAKEIAEFNDKILRSLENSIQMIGKIISLFVEVSPIKNFAKKELEREEEQIFHSSHRGLLNNFHIETTQHDSTNPPPTVFPTTPIANPVTTPANVPVVNPAPTIVTVPATLPVTVPATNPITITPNPTSTPVTVPSSTPVPVPYTNPASSPVTVTNPASSPVPVTNPVSSPVPVTNPVTTPSVVPGATPTTNPVTTYPAPSGTVPVTTPIANPVTPPATANSPAIAGQSWCVAKSGALETALQAALDYACGIGGADCSTIQQSGSCYNPNSLENHASYAFNSYYQKNPVQTSCDFGGAAMITNVNPSTGSCIYPSSSSSSSSPMTVTPTPTTSSSSGAAVPGSDSPPSVLNTSNPASGATTVFGDNPPSVTNTTSMSTSLQPFIGYIILVTSIITGRLILDM